MGSPLLAMSLAMAGNIKVVWQPNAEPDLAGYFVYYGTQSGVYSQRLQVGRPNNYTIRDVAPGKIYFIAVTAVDTAGNESAYSQQVSVRVSAASEPEGGAPRQHQLLQTHPNPYHLATHENTTITFELYQPSHVKLEIFDVLGHAVITLVNEARETGQQKVVWSGRDHQGRPVRTGIYLYRLITAGQTTTHRLLVYR
jgi:hypothetical protein